MSDETLLVNETTDKLLNGFSDLVADFSLIAPPSLSEISEMVTSGSISNTVSLARRMPRYADVLTEWACIELRTGGSIPVEVGNFVADAIGSGKPPKKRGRHPLRNRFRDLQIGMAVYRLEEQGIAPLRNEVTESPSGCSIVAAALHRVAEIKGVPSLRLSEAAVAKIWQRLSRMRATH